MKNDLISVIVPIYKVEKYIHECVDSILAQTYTNLEIILVDDGSPDNCGKICDEYAAKDSRIKVIHQENGGVSSARNAGLDAVTGNYIGWVDPDDFIEINMFEELYRSIMEFHSDLSVCGVKKFGLDSRSEIYENKCVNQSDYLRELLVENIKSYLWNKLYKKHLFDNIRFPEGEVFEDMKIMHLVGERISSASFTDKTFYNYRIRQYSITFDNRGVKAKDYMSAAHNRSNRYKGTEFYTYAVAGEFRCLRVIVSEISSTQNLKGTYRQLFKKSKELYKICKNEIKGIQKILSIVYLTSPKLYSLLKKTYLNR